MDSVVLLSGGTGGAKLARGLLDACDDLTVVANTGDDIDVYGVHASPDPDLVTYWLADEIDERGWGLRDDTWHVMEALERAGRPSWFRLGDRDLAMCLIRTERLRAGQTLTQAHHAVVDALGVPARVLPMSDQPVSTWVSVRGRELPFQEFMIVERAEGPIEGIELRGLHRAPPSNAVLQAIAEADVVSLGPGSWYTSVLPHLLVPRLREALAGARARVVVVLNLEPQPGETDGFSPQEHLEVLLAHLGGVSLHTVIADATAVVDRRGLLSAVQACGAELVLAPVAAPDGAPRHDAPRLAAALASMVGAR